MNKFVSALWRLLGGLTLAAAVAWLAAAQTGANPHNPIPDRIWSVTDLATSGYDHALAIDSTNGLHFLFQNPTDGVLRYVVAQGPDTGFDDIADVAMSLPYLTFDLAIRPDDVPCLVYATETTSLSHPLDTTLQYGCRGDEGWQIAAVDDGGGSAQLAFGADGRPHIAFIQHNAAVYLTYRDDQWWKETVATDSAYMGVTWLLMDGDGRPHVIYGGSDGTFEAVLESNGLWAKTPLDVTGAFIPQLDSAGRLWWLLVVTEDTGGHPPIYDTALYLHRPDDSPGNQGEPIDARHDWRYTADFVLRGDIPHLVYNAGSDSIMYRWLAPAGWQEHELLAANDGKLNLVLANYGEPQARVAFTHENHLKIAYRSLVFSHGENVFLPGVLGSP